MKWTHERMNRARQQGDPAADALIQQLVDTHGSDQARRIFDLLIRRVELPFDSLPAPIKEFVDQHAALPDWAQSERIQQAENVFLDHGPKFLVFLFYKSLPTLYAFAHGSQVLADTGRLAHEGERLEIFSRRVAETGQFLLDVMSPGGLADLGPGIHAALKVRLIHAAIRYFLKERDWDQEKLGVPINQEDLVSTLMTFSISMIEGMELSEMPLSLEEAEAYLHSWKVVGHYMGIEADLIPDNVEEGKQLLAFTIDRQARSSDSGRLLVQSLISFGEATIPGKLFDNIPRIFIRHLVGRKLSRILGVQPRFGILYFLLPKVIRRIFGWIEQMEDLSEPVAHLTNRYSRKLVAGMVNVFHTYKDAPFRIPHSLQKGWEIPPES